MTYLDNDLIRNPDDPWEREWGTGSMIASVIAVVIMAGIVAYGVTKSSDTTTNSSTISWPNTTG
jgi:hypothetical protein